MIPRKTSDFAETAFDDETVVMRMSDGDFFAMEGSAHAIWNLIDGERSRDEILAGLQRDYAGDPAMGEDLDAFLASLRSAGLLA
ncbi:PqqD family protein [Alteriqipengyuania flavescens]|uniref:PqqD family protein n=1 Tax=Alteriqipengyuania flavescens TaxID=3053610 RepID=UPI0025B3BC26|nr:PqqD family protein [Alteriqipengyuania flavescens]WJY19698.1 PqqD family protein [Alteriqipengyuania flavescens]WJY25638.1 PqqD family protein [Alteriqipengyuania flavescens]